MEKTIGKYVEAGVQVEIEDIPVSASTSREDIISTSSCTEIAEEEGPPCVSLMRIDETEPIFTERTSEDNVTIDATSAADFEEQPVSTSTPTKTSFKIRGTSDDTEVLEDGSSVVSPMRSDEKEPTNNVGQIEANFEDPPESTSISPLRESEARLDSAQNVDANCDNMDVKYDEDDEMLITPIKRRL